MKVLHLLKTSQGASWAFRQMRELVKLGVDVHVVLPDRAGNGLTYTDAGIQVHVLDLDISLNQACFLPFQILRLKELIQRVRPDLVHSHFFATTVLMRLAMRRSPIPRLFQVPGPLHLEHFFFRYLEMSLSGPTDYWTASCEWTQKKYRSMVPDKTKVSLSYYGTDVEKFVKKEGEKTAVCRELGISEQSTLIGMVAYMYGPKRYLGQQRGLKGHEDLIDAVAILIEQKYDVALVFVGGAWGRAAAYEKKVMEYGLRKLGNRVFFLGTRQDVARLYSGFDMAVHPSHSENVGGAVESLLMKIPTITTTVGGFPDVIRHQTTGLLAEPENPVDLAEKILYYLENPGQARQQARSGYDYTKWLFNVERTASQMKGIYETIVSPRASAQ
jgi:glycosyltransferase involved in cell wall biosynthesis